jgi:ABC-type cobalamin/Fe3+-siderophores transport system ATPase subunit
MQDYDVELDTIDFTYPETEESVFTGFSFKIPHGVVSLVGQNGTGKSTLLLLAGGRLLPDSGTIRVLGKDTAEITDEEERNRYVSFIYQNMEFETESSIGELVEFVFENGFHEAKDSTLIKDLIIILELEDCLKLPLQKLAKGQIQRAIIAFSVLYGSKIIMMDEPVFAMEDYQKKRAMGFLTEYAENSGVSIYYSAHELELSRFYADHVMLFFKDQRVMIGSPEGILTPENLEEAYEYPAGMLYKKEHFYREKLKTMQKLVRGKDE